MTSAAPLSKLANVAAFSPSDSMFSPRQSTNDSSTSPVALRKSLEQARYKPDASVEPHEAPYMSPASIRIRYLPRSMTRDTLAGMLLFAEDLLDSNFTTSDLPEDSGFMTAVAHFKTYDAAKEARAKLHGKPTSEAHLVVEILAPYGERRSEEIDGAGPPNATSIHHSNSNGRNSRSLSRFSSTFQSINARPLHGASIHPIDPHDEELQYAQNLFGNVSSPRSTSYIDPVRMSGKSVIEVDDTDDDTGELLRDPIAFANKKGHGAMPRRGGPTAAGSLPISRMNSLSLNTNDVANPKGLHISPPAATSFRSMQSIGSPNSELSPTTTRSAGFQSMSPAGGFPLSPQHLQRHHYPPANPADQNPPCNTLYVGNLPMDTSEDELKAVFSKQRGYKRLCFRTKHNGPMCFVEFEDVSFATKALNELYGHPLHNSVKGGIRLSFSKNPLGVRSGQINSLGPNSPLGSPTGLGFSNGLGAPPGFSTASGPPPGLGVPPGLSPPLSAGAGMTGFFSPTSPQSIASSLHAARGSIANGYATSSPNGMPQSPHNGSFH